MNNYRDFSEVDRVLYEPSRLIIATILYTVETVDFLFLLRETGLTKGNLSKHLTRLEEAGYLTIEKSYRGKIPQTLCTLTSQGRAAYKAQRHQLKRMLETMASAEIEFDPD